MASLRLLAALPLLLACEAGHAPAATTPPPAAPAQAEAAAAPAPPVPPAPAEPAPPPPPPLAATLVREAAALEPGEAVLPLPAEGEATVEPSATFRVVLSAPSKDARLALLDASDAAVPAVADTEIGDGTLLTLAPSAPLTPGARYRLRLDGAVDRALHAGEVAYLPAAWELHVTGQPPPPPARPAHRKRGRR